MSVGLFLRYLHPLRRPQMLIAIGYLLHEGFSQLAEGCAGDAVRIQGDGLAAIAAFADALDDRDLSEQRDVQFLGQAFATFFAEEVVFVLRQLGGGEPGHILDEAEDGDVHLLAREHADSLAGIGEGDFLRRADHDGTGDGKRLYHCQMDVARSRREVYQEVV